MLALEHVPLMARKISLMEPCMQLSVLNPFTKTCTAKLPEGFQHERYSIADAASEDIELYRNYPGLYEVEPHGYIDTPFKAGALNAYAHSNSLRTALGDFYRSNPIFEHWRSLMPDPTPQALEHYQESYNANILAKIDQLIKQYGVIPPEGQVLFHGGQMADLQGQYITNRPLATSFCPGAALLNGLHNGKAFNAGYIDLVMLTVEEPVSKAFFFSHENEVDGISQKGHEREVLFEAGATVTFSERIQIRDDFRSGSFTETKKIPSFLVLATIS